MPVLIKRVLLDALKPRELLIVTLAKAIGEVDNIKTVEIIVSEVDSNTETIKVTIKGSEIDYDGVKKTMEQHGVSIRGIDEITVGKSNEIQ